MAEPNLLYYGNNLDVLRRHVKDESVDLVYLNPPSVPLRCQIALCWHLGRMARRYGTGDGGTEGWGS